MTRYVLPGESDAYRQGRQELFAAEIALRDQIERAAQMRRALPLGLAMPDYVFRTGPDDLSRDDPNEFTDVHLKDLFENGHDTLIVDHLMFASKAAAPCIMCSTWADGYNAVAPHIRQQTNFVLVAKAEIGKLRRWARERGWDQIRLLSSHDSTFNRDLGMENKNDDQDQGAGLSVFSRDQSGVIHHRYTVDAGFDGESHDPDLYAGDERGIDLYTPVWHLLDLLPAGREGWYPGHDYMKDGSRRSLLSASV